MAANEIYHHGVKGMKWGIRRFQNKDGSLTGEGKKRYRSEAESLTDDDLKKAIARRTLEKKYNETSKGKVQMEKTKKTVDATSNMVNTLKSINNKRRNRKVEIIDLSSMSDKELRDKINRANLERQYLSMYSPAVKKTGRDYVDSILDGAGATLAVGSSALGLALAIKELRG